MMVSHNGELLGWDFCPIAIIRNNTGLNINFSGNEISTGVTDLKNITSTLIST
jgi:hypothetical protein